MSQYILSQKVEPSKFPSNPVCSSGNAVTQKARSAVMRPTSAWERPHPGQWLTSPDNVDGAVTVLCKSELMLYDVATSGTACFAARTN